MPKFSVKKPLTILVATLAVVVLGVVAYLKMTPDLMPNMDFPYVILITSDPGASPEAIEQSVTRPLEQSMATLDQIKSVTSSSQDSVSMVVLEFEDGVNMDTVSIDIQQKISALQASWDDTVSSPYVLKMNPSMIPTLVAAISRDGADVQELSDFVTDELTGKLEGISGVAGVTVSGAVTRQMHIVLDQEKLNAVSARLADAVSAQMDAAEGQLTSAQAQITSAQQAIDNALSAALTGAADEAAAAVNQAIGSITQARDDAQTAIRNQRRLLEIDASLARLELLRQKEQAGIITDSEREELASLAAQEPALKAERDALKAAGGDSADKVSEALKQLEQIAADLQELLKKLQDPAYVTGQGEALGQTLLTVVNQLRQINLTDSQLASAKSQIAESLASLAAAREQAAGQTDLGGMLSISTVSGILTAQNFSMPAGYINDDDGVRYMVSVGEEFSSAEELSDLVLFDLGIDGVEPIRLSDVATVFSTDDSDEIYTKLNGENGILASFTKQSTYATAEVSKNISARFDQLSAQYEGLHFTPLMDQGDYISLIVRTILSSLLWGALFSVLVLFLFLRDWRPTIITLVSIPLSLVFAIVLMYFSGVTINMISLSGLAVAVGMLVDNSVVVVENIYRLRARGATIVQAAVSGAGQVLGAITSSTLTTVCVFLPIVFVEGLTKQLFTDLALTMTYSLLASLLVALTVVPAMSAGLLRRDITPKPGLLDRVYPAYRRAVGWSLRHKAAVLLLALVLLVGSAAAALSRGFVFMPDIDMNNLNLTITMPEDATREEAVALADEVVRRAMTVENVETVGVTMGNTMMSGSLSDGESYDVTAYITMPEGTFGSEAGRQIEALCADLPCKVEASGVMSSSMSYMTGSGISVKLYSDDMEAMQSAAKQLAAAMGGVEGVGEVDDGLDSAAEALHITVDRSAAMEKGMTVAQVYMQIAAALTNSSTLSDMTLDSEKMDLVIESPEDSRVTVETLLDLELTPSSSATFSMESSSPAAMGGSASGSSLSALTGSDSSSESTSFRLGDVATAEKTVSLSTIQRDQQRRCLTLTAAVSDGYNVTKVTSAVQKAFAGETMPDGVSYEFSGENEQIMTAMKQVMLMLLLGVLLVYFIMVAQFQSLKSPFIVMFTIPLAFTGGFLALLIAGINISVISLIGFVMLVGIIVNNGIVLVDCINQERLGGMERREAIIEAGVTRLRPILMTSLTTVLGLTITALAKNAGTALMQPVALVCIGGLLYATLMTLFVVPCMYDIVSKKEPRRVDEKELELIDL